MSMMKTERVITDWNSRKLCFGEHCDSNQNRFSVCPQSDDDDKSNDCLTRNIEKTMPRMHKNKNSMISDDSETDNTDENELDESTRENDKIFSETNEQIVRKQRCERLKNAFRDMRVRGYCNGNFGHREYVSTLRSNDDTYCNSISNDGSNDSFVGNEHAIERQDDGVDIKVEECTNYLDEIYEKYLDSLAAKHITESFMCNVGEYVPLAPKKTTVSYEKNLENENDLSEDCGSASSSFRETEISPPGADCAPAPELDEDIHIDRDMNEDNDIVDCTENWVIPKPLRHDRPYKERQSIPAYFGSKVESAEPSIRYRHSTSMPSGGGIRDSLSDWKLFSNSNKIMQKSFKYGVTWTDKHIIHACQVCNEAFGKIRLLKSAQKHHCRSCGKVICSKCSRIRMLTTGAVRKQRRVCTDCCAF